MRIVFYPSLCLPFHGRTLSERPLGGTETGVIRLAESLAKLGQDVVVVSQFEKPPLTEAVYLPERAVGDIGSCDVLVAVRDWRPLFAKLDCKKRFYWTGDSYDQPQNIGIGDKRVIERMDNFLAVSAWQAEQLSEHSGYPFEKCHVIKNGIHPPYFEDKTFERHRKRLIYSSTPYRGLAHMPDIYRELLKRHPEGLEFHVFSGYSVYAGVDGKFNEMLEADFKKLCDELGVLPGVYLRGNVHQSELAKEFLQSSILCYPNTFEETSCITAMEAQAAGCATVTSKLGALPETLGEAGVLIGGEAGTPEYNSAFVDAVDLLLKDDAEFEKYAQVGLKQSEEFSWDKVAKRFLEIC